MLVAPRFFKPPELRGERTTYVDRVSRTQRSARWQVAFKAGSETLPYCSNRREIYFVDAAPISVLENVARGKTKSLATPALLAWHSAHDAEAEGGTEWLPSGR